MTRIGILSDTHCFLHEKIFDFFASCDQLWHAGDFGNLDTAEQLAEFKPLIGVYGNIDGQELRVRFPEKQLIKVEQHRIFITHIGGTPSKYDLKARSTIESLKPTIFVCGHSHICKIQYDQRQNLLYINPGAAGKYGFHTKITLVRFVIDGSNLKDMEILELDKH
ncbi:MAG TPA: metallophosphoesterase family protein [Bacteroidales bacterium]|nr:metallophosphoesterase family protein [Bacteroidales bacterium]HPS27074.1 metallophosphoesterase family protein [Bacteroidales bacterium]